MRFVVTEYGIADLLGKSIRERAMALISIAHPDFRGERLEAAKERHYVFQATHEPRGRDPRELEREVRAKDGRLCRMRALKPSDEQKIQTFFYGVSHQTVHKRFMQVLESLPYDRLQDLIDVDYENDLALVLEHGDGHREPEIVAVAQYYRDKASNLAEVAFMVADEWQRQGLGTQLFSELAEIAETHGIRGFTAEVLAENRPMLHLFHSTGLEIKSSVEAGTYHLEMPFRTERI
ncbi:MAG: GNAT family N-acetyltransferase [Planctomycetes bacterium]|nr:GNAT family N-acetyltransferase [Planctomycetota bacterium]